MRRILLLVVVVTLWISPIGAQENKAAGPKPARVEVTSRVTEVEAGQQLKFSAIGYDEAGIGSLRPGIDPGDDALDPAPALSGIVELGEAAPLAVRRRPCEAFGSLFPSAATWRENAALGARPKIHPVGAAPVEHLRTGIMAVAAQ